MRKICINNINNIVSILKYINTIVNLPLSLRLRNSFDDPFQTGGVSDSIWFNSYDIRYHNAD